MNNPEVLKQNPLIIRKKPTKPSGYLNILHLFRNSVVELKFRRRLPLPNPRTDGHRNPVRRMLCTANWMFISSPLVSKMFKWKKPKSNRGPSWYKKRNLLIVWDLLNNDFRMISLDKWDIIATVPTQKFFDKVRFSVFYKMIIKRMTEIDRKYFADK